MEFAGKRFCITGAFETLQNGSEKTVTRKIVTDWIKEKGGTIQTTISGNLNYLILGAKGSQLYRDGKKGIKIMKAEELKIPIISEDKLLTALES